MKKLFEIINYNMSAALGWTLIHSIWQGVAILLIFSIIFYFFKPSSTRYWIGLGALGLQFLSAIVTFSIIYQPVSKTANFGSNASFTHFLNQTSQLSFKPNELSFLQKTELFLQANLDLFVTFWFIGTSLLLFRLMIGFVYVQQLKTQKNVAVTVDIQKLMDNLLKKVQMPVSIKLLESAMATVPMTIGWIKPVILLPVGIASGLTVKQLEAILAHELAHIKRYDYLVNIFQNVVEILFFFHPATWFISGKVRDERENCCDDFAVEICGDSMILAKALTQVASYQQQPRLAMAFGAKRQTFMDRIKRIIGINDSKPLSYGNWIAVLGMVLVVALGVVYAQKEVFKNEKSLVNPKIKEEKKLLANTAEALLEEKQNIVISDTSSLDEVSNEMERLSKEMEKYSKEMEMYGKQMEEKYGREMQKHGEEMQQVQRKMQAPQRKIQDLSIQMQEVSLAMQKIHNKYMDSNKIPLEAEQKLKNLEKQERVLEKQMHEVEQQMNSFEAEMLPFEQKMNQLQAPMDSLGRLMERYSKPMDSLGRIMEEKGKLLEKLAKEEEIRFKKQLQDFSEMLFKAGLIKDKNDFEVRLKGEKLLIDLEPQSPAIYEKVWNWMNQTWGANHRDIRGKDLRIRVKGDNINFSTSNDNNNYNYNRTGNISAPMAPLPPSRVSPTPRIAPPARERNISTPKPPKPVRVGVVDKNFQISDGLIRDNKGTCSVYVVSEKSGEFIAKAVNVTLVNDKWTTKGLKVGDKVILKSDIKVKNGDAVEILAISK
ncbi:hypothetical protein EMA8858_02422 [Emticicia aquatica]|uniref:Peptidase M56 domain-containing protein n=1 Tax=Emticicia aquatica TaxID=1681835 RepID=A0ABN8EWF3_9BACT|nr:M56 family metallopeptidase [Emticicia aquatica]CAH0996291.1 hypothetical protein EMA8858_02422 [Emticicia aquatica]